MSGGQAPVATGSSDKPSEWVLKRNCSISPRGLALVFGSLAGVSLAIGAGFAVLGLWGVLPFAGIEMLALVAAFACTSRRAADRERITLAGGMLTVERVTGAFGGQLASEERFNAHWVRVDVDQGPAGRVVLSAGGRRSEVGRFVGHERRRRLAREMRIALRELR